MGAPWNAALLLPLLVAAVSAMQAIRRDDADPAPAYRLAHQGKKFCKHLFEADFNSEELDPIKGEWTKSFGNGIQIGKKGVKACAKVCEQLPSCRFFSTNSVPDPQSGWCFVAKACDAPIYHREYKGYVIYQMNMTEDLGHVALKNEAGEMEVHHAEDFENVARKILSALGPGKEYSFPPGLTQEQRGLVEAIAGDLGHVHRAQGEDKACTLTVANLAAFRGEAEATLDGMKPGEACIIRPRLSPMQRHLLHSLAEARGWSSESLADGEHRTVRVRRKAQEAPMDDGGLAASLSYRSAADGDGPGDASTALASIEANPQKNKGQDAEEETDDEESSEEEEDADPEHCMIQKVFYLFASGSHKGQKIFLRFPDLKDFVNSVQGVMPHWHRTFTNFEHVLENTFVDTVQMQVDMDPVRTSKGLSLKWFQVFIQSAMRKIGMSVLSLLLALLQTVE